MNNTYADAPVSITEDKSNVLLSLEEMTGATIDSIDSIKEELKTKKLNLDSALMSDQEYTEATTIIKELTKRKKQAKERLMKNPAILQLSLGIETLQKEQKEKKAALSDYLLELNRLTQQLSFTFGSHEYEIVREATVQKRR